MSCRHMFTACNQDLTVACYRDDNQQICKVAKGVEELEWQVHNNITKWLVLAWEGGMQTV